MTQDAWLWGLAAAASGCVYAWLVIRLRNCRVWQRLLWLREILALAAVATTFCGITGLWWLYRWMGAAALIVGTPLGFALAVVAAVRAADKEENDAITKITGS